MKKCRICKAEKQFLDFYACALRKHDYVCKSCWNKRTRANRKKNPERIRRYEVTWRNKSESKLKIRAKHAKREYGITLQEYEAIVNQSCNFCGKPPPSYCDHDHRTGEIRGSLCISCNRSLGRLGDGIEGLQRMIQYCLEKPGQRLLQKKKPQERVSQGA